jgi:hypothetical protein
MTSFPATPAPSPLSRRSKWPAVTRADFDAQRTPEGALLVGDAEEVVEKVLRHSEVLGGISRPSFQMNAASLPHAKIMQAIEAIGTRVAPALRQGLADESNLDQRAMS